MLYRRQDTLVFLPLTWLLLHTLDTIGTKQLISGCFFSCWFWSVPGLLRLLRRGGSSCRLGGGSLRQTTVNKQVLWFVPTKYEWIYSDILNGLLCFAIQMDSWEFPETASSDPAAGCYCLRRPSCRTETNHQRDTLPPIRVPCLLVFSKLLAGFFCASSLEVASFWDDSHVTNLTQCAAYGLSTDRLTLHPSTSAAVLAALICSFFKDNARIGCWARALNFDLSEACPEWSLTC